MSATSTFCVSIEAEEGRKSVGKYILILPFGRKGGCIVVVQIQRGFNVGDTLPRHMKIYHGGGNTFVAHHFLNTSNVVAGLQHMSCKAVAQGMDTPGTVDSRFFFWHL